MVEWAAGRLQRLRASQLVEDGIQRQRRSETKSPNFVMAPDRLYATLVQKQVLSKVHDYDEAFSCLGCPFSSQHDPRWQLTCPTSGSERAHTHTHTQVVTYSCMPPWPMCVVSHGQCV